MLELPGRIALGMDVADLLELQGTFESNRVERAAAEIEHVARIGHGTGDGLDLVVPLEHLESRAGISSSAAVSSTSRAAPNRPRPLAAAMARQARSRAGS